MRPALEYCRKKFFDNDVVYGIEIGVREGDNAIDILSSWDKVKLLLVDPVPRFEVKRAFTQFPDRVQFFKGISAGVMRNLTLPRLDFVYIDGAHDYTNVMMDLKIWIQHIDSHGMLCGHDYSYYEPGVIVAVDQFAEKHNFVVHANILDNPDGKTWTANNLDWWIDLDEKRD